MNSAQELSSPKRDAGPAVLTGVPAEHSIRRAFSIAVSSPPRGSLSDPAGLVTAPHANGRLTDERRAER
jgi:hypothetical protein